MRRIRRRRRGRMRSRRRRRREWEGGRRGSVIADQVVVSRNYVPPIDRFLLRIFPHKLCSDNSLIEHIIEADSSKNDPSLFAPSAFERSISLTSTPSTSSSTPLFSLSHTLNLVPFAHEDYELPLKMQLCAVSGHCVTVAAASTVLLTPISVATVHLSLFFSFFSSSFFSFAFHCC